MPKNNIPLLQHKEVDGVKCMRKEAKYQSEI